MKLETPCCPECGEPPRGTVDTLNGCAIMEQRPDGAFEYTGRTDLWYDEQKTQEDDQGRIRLICDNGHEWHSCVDGLAESREAL